MPDDLIGGINNFGMSLIQNTANAWMQGRENRQSRQWSEKMYQQQRKDALADWQMQAEYNSPAKQMERLKAAGLNPNLVYGHGADAQMGSPVRASSYGSYNPVSERSGFSSGGLTLDQYFNAQLKQAQVDNLQAQNDVIKNEALLKAFNLRRGETLLPGQSASLDLGNRLAQQEYEVGLSKLASMLLERQVLANRNEREAMANSQNITESVARIGRMSWENAKDDYEMREIKQRVMLLYQDEKLKDFELEMYDKGYRPQDPLWQRKVMDILNWIKKGYGDLGELLKLPATGPGFFFGK